jgi:hypothetical protein
VHGWISSTTQAWLRNTPATAAAFFAAAVILLSQASAGFGSQWSVLAAAWLSALTQ